MVWILFSVFFSSLFGLFFAIAQQKKPIVWDCEINTNIYASQLNDKTEF